ncbi:SCO2524 family protein [Streptomyces sp. NBC_01275]|uniref:SCO2524 family protein n=1 Tax=Streptomyces sp. NBC_01275 TaxID=2903807 RepID=UPI0022513662|nr:SCO2524 family protein [Streptomyces sp. NBC_01275]MCX4762036.1 SCO2524 family protein [Streptomyces sp. NBC_01275]
MQIKPRQNLLEVWQAIARHSFDNGEWDWGEWGGRSSVADAERLLCLLYPATEIEPFRLDDPDTTQLDVERALRNAGDSSEIPANLVEILGDFMEKHRGEESPTFAGGYYFAPEDPKQELTKEQREVGVVDAYSMSITLCLATLGFLKVYRGKTQRASTLARIDRLREETSARLTAAMVSLLRSFTVNVVDISSDQGQSLARLLGRGRLSDRQVLQRFQDRFKSLRALISESVTLGLDTDVTDQLRNENRLFECGWAWSLVKGAPEIELEPQTAQAIGKQPQGVARAVPYLYFTVVALDGIPDLSSERTLVLGLLNAEQQKLADALRLRWEITQQYWSAIARFDAATWPLEEIPWRTTLQQLESEYFSLSVASILVHDLVRRRATDDDLTRTVAVMERLAERGRITSGTTREDPAIGLHNPGVTLPLLGSEDIGPAMKWTMGDFSAQLLKRTIQLGALSRSIGSQDRLLRLSEDILDHLWQRRVNDGEGVGLWDNVHAVYPESPVRQGPLSWSITERVTECMVAAHALYSQDPIRSNDMSTLAQAALSEAAHLFGKEQMLQPAPTPKSPQGEEIKGIEADLRRARELVDKQPGTAHSLALGVLSRLYALARARGTGSRGV